MVSPFILHCFPFSFTGEQKGKKSLKRCWWIVWVIHTYYITLMVKYMCTWLHNPLKLLSSTMFLLCINSSQHRWFHVKTYMCSWLWFANMAATNYINHYQLRTMIDQKVILTVYQFTSWTTNSIYLNKYSYTFFYLYSLLIQLLC